MKRLLYYYVINRHFKDLDLDDIIKKNQEVAKKKREKRGMSENAIRDAANIKTKTLDNKAINTSCKFPILINLILFVSYNSSLYFLEKARSIKANAKPGSLAAKANMVKEFNERNSRK